MHSFYIERKMLKINVHLHTMRTHHTPHEPFVEECKHTTQNTQWLLSYHRWNVCDEGKYATGCFYVRIRCRAVFFSWGEYERQMRTVLYPKPNFFDFEQTVAKAETNKQTHSQHTHNDDDDQLERITAVVAKITVKIVGWFPVG